MRVSRLLPVVILVLSLILVRGESTRAETAETHGSEKLISNAQSLAGAEGFYVFVAEDDDFDLVALDEDVLRRTVETEMRNAGIRVIPFNDHTKSLDTPFLHLRTMLVRQPDGKTFALNVEVSVHQTVRMIRNDRLLVASTWSNGRVGTAEIPLVRETVLEQLHDLLAMFVRDYLAANSR